MSQIKRSSCNVLLKDFGAKAVRGIDWVAVERDYRAISDEGDGNAIFDDHDRRVGIDLLPMLEAAANRQTHDLKAPDIGYYTVDQRPRCLDDLPPRRMDVGKAAYGTGAATVDTVRAWDVPCVLATPDTRPLETIATEQGPIRLPRGPVADGTFMPATSTLDALPYTGSRRTAISDRYYR